MSPIVTTQRTQGLDRDSTQCRKSDRDERRGQRRRGNAGNCCRIAWANLKDNRPDGVAWSDYPSSSDCVTGEGQRSDAGENRPENVDLASANCYKPRTAKQISLGTISRYRLGTIALTLTRVASIPSKQGPATVPEPGRE